MGKTQLLGHFLRSIRHKGVRGQAEKPEGFCCVKEHGLESFRVGWVFGEDPGRGFVDVLITELNQSPRRFKCAIKFYPT